MRVRLAGVAVVALLAAGCGGGGGSSSSTADSLVPADAVAFATFDTDTSSTQVSNGLKILDKFPIEPTAERQLRAMIKQNGVDLDTLTSSAGPEVDFAVLKVNGKTLPVGFARPSDEQAFDAQLAKGPEPYAKLKGWTVFADDQASVDAVTKHSGASLADDATFQAATKTLPAAGDAIATFFVSTAGLQTALGAATANLGSTANSLNSLTSSKWVAGSLTSQDGAFKLEAHAKRSGLTTAPTGSGLADKVPAGSIVAMALQGGGATIPASAQEQLSVLGQQIGVDLPALVSAVTGPVIAYVRPGIPLPEVTIAARPTKPQAAANAIGGLLARFAQGGAKAVPTQVDGGTMNKLDLGPVALYYGVNAGQLVVTDSANALSELKGSVGHLTDDAVFKDAKDGAGMSDSSNFVYVDIKDALPALSGFAQLANQSLPPAVENNLRPLKSLLAYGSRDGDVETFVAYVKTS